LEFDANADGKLTKAELEAGQRSRFNRLDGNKDGSATPEEIAAGREAEAKANMEAARKQRFTDLDKDKNGQLSQAEFLAAVDERPDDCGPRLRMAVGDGPGPLTGPPRLPGAPGRERGPRGPGFGAGDDRAFAGPADADKDGKLTFAEFSTRGNEAFARADANKDGTVTIAELQAGGPRIR
jgi:Ca2+-binding EF-hand superfamily protein